MSGQDLFERILHSLHAAAFDDALWPAASGLIDEHCGAKGSFLVFGDGAARDDIDIFFARFCFGGQRHTALERLYFETYHAIDERLPRIRSLPDSQVAHVSSLFTEEEKKTSAIYNEALPLADTGDSLNVRLDGPEGSRIVWVVADPVAGDGWSSSRVEAVERVLPHLRQFVRVRQALVDARALGASMAELFDNDRTGVIQLDRRARVAAVNDRARALLNERDGLRDEGGYLGASLPGEDAKLQRLLAQALPFFGGAGASGSMLVSRAEPLARLAVHVSPVGEGGAYPRRSRLGALVLVDDPAARASIDPERIGNILGLTPAESRIAVLLAQGKSIDAVAAETGRSRTTVKWHIRHIYAKHGLSRQVELAQLVTSLADVPGTQS